MRTAWLLIVALAACKSEFRWENEGAKLQHAQEARDRVQTCKNACADPNMSLPYQCITYSVTGPRCHCHCPNGSQPQIEGINP